MVIGLFLPAVVSVVVLVFGLWVYLRPIQIIELQKKFYATINWRMEPIDITKEIRNTKAMGLFLIVFVVGVWVWMWF